MRVITRLARSLVLACALGATAAAAGLFPTYPTGSGAGVWEVDRYAPAGFTNAGTVNGRPSVLALALSASDSQANRPPAFSGTFYNTQGRGFQVDLPAYSVLYGSVYLPSPWATTNAGDALLNRRSEMWGVLSPATGGDTCAGSACNLFPIIGFTNASAANPLTQGGAGRYRVFDSNIGFVDLGTPVGYDQWTDVCTVFTGGELRFYINGALVYVQSSLVQSDTSFGPPTKFTRTIMQAYNFGSDYTAQWSTLGAGTASGGSVAAGNNQSTGVNTAFPIAIQVLATDSGGAALPCVPVTFAVPASGASATLSTTTAITNAQGIAQVMATANGTTGAYVMTATLVNGTVVNVNLQNGAVPATITGGGSQSTPVNTAFAAPLVATVTDAASAPVAGVTVTFVTPGSGASGTFPGYVTSATAVTNASGIATSPVLTANAVSGAFVATASVVGVATPATFNLLNTSVASYTVVVTPSTPDWAFATESGTGAGTFVVGPGTPPAGIGSVELEAVTTNGGELFYTQQFAGMRLSSVKALQYSTYVGAGPNASALNIDIDPDLDAPATSYKGRLVFVPNIIPGAVVPGTWQTWDALTQKGWYATRPPINALCTLAAPCTLADVLAVYPNAGVMAQFLTGIVGFKIGNSGATGTVSVDKFLLMREGPPSTLTAWTYDFEPASTAPATIAAVSGTPQATPITTAFAAPLQALVRDVGGQLLSGLTVTFTLPGTGPSGTFPGGLLTATGVTGSSGVATSPVVTANGIPGSFSATAGVTGLATTASFALTNTVQAVTLAKSMVPASITPGGTSLLTLTLANPNPASIALTAAFDDVMPTGVTVTSVNTGTCTGVTVTVLSISRAAGSTIPSGGCTIVVTVTSSTVGAVVNTTSALATVAGTAPPASATLTVVASGASLAKSIQPGTINAGGSATLTLTLGNAGATGIALTAPFSDSMPAGLTTAGGNTGTCPGVTVGVSLLTMPSGAVIPAGGCTIIVAVTSTTAGTVTNTTSALQTSAGTVAPASASLTVVAALAPQLAKAFAPAAIAPGGTSTLTLTLAQAFPGALTLTAPFTDGMPPGVAITGANTGTCANVSATPALITMPAGTTIPTGGCTIVVAVASSTPGVAVNTTSVLATSGGTAPAASASLTVAAITLAASGGGGQSAVIGTPFPAVLQATVTGGGSPVAGVAVTFSLPPAVFASAVAAAVGVPTGTFPGGASSVTVTTNALGVAMSPVITANGVVGSYAASAAVAGVATPVSYALTNIAALPALVEPIPALGIPGLLLLMLAVLAMGGRAMAASRRR